jgi:hypothetical protein
VTQHDTYCGSWSCLPIITQQPIFRGDPLLPQWRRAKTRVLGSSFALATEPSPVPRHQTRGSQYVIKEFIPNNLTSMAIFWRFSYIQIKRNAHLFVKPCFISSEEICFYLKGMCYCTLYIAFKCYNYNIKKNKTNIFTNSLPRNDNLSWNITLCYIYIYLAF